MNNYYRLFSLFYNCFFPLIRGVNYNCTYVGENEDLTPNIYYYYTSIIKQAP